MNISKFSQNNRTALLNKIPFVMSLCAYVLLHNNKLLKKESVWMCIVLIEICFNGLPLLHVCSLEPVSLLMWSLEDTYIIQIRVVPPSCSITSVCCTKTTCQEGVWEVFCLQVFISRFKGERLANEIPATPLLMIQSNITWRWYIW